MRQRVTAKFPTFAGGLNLAADAASLGEGEMRRAENARLTEYGGATRRGGSKRLTATALGSPSAVRGVYAFRTASDVELLAVCNGELLTGAYAVPISLNAETGALSASQPPSFATFRHGSGEACFIADGGLLNHWDGTTLTVNVANTPAVTQLAVYNERLYGITGTSEALYWSSLGNGATLGVVASGGGTANVRTFGNQKLTGLLALGGSLLLFHVDGISRFTGVGIDDINIEAGTRGVSQDVGTIAPFSLVSVETTGYVATERGVYEVTESGVRDISAKIAPVFADLADEDLAGIRAVHRREKREVWFMIPSKGIYAYNYRLQAWAGPWVDGVLDPAITCLCEAVDTNGRSIVLAGDEDGYIRHCDFPDVFVDNMDSDGTGGAAYTFAVQPRRLFFGGIGGEVSLRWAHVMADFRGSEDATLSWLTPSAGGTFTMEGAATATWDSGALWDSGLAWDSGNTSVEKVPIHGRGPFVDLTLADDGESDAVFSRVEVEGFAMNRR